MKEPLFTIYIKKTILVTKSLFTKQGLVIATPIALTLPVLSTIQQALWLLFWLMVLDFITGVMASGHEKKEAEKTKPELVNESLISSEKLKKSGFKILLYMCSILAVYRVQKIFMIKSFSVSFANIELSIALMVVLFWCLVELFSIVFENFKKMGFDVVKKISTIFSTVKTIKNEFHS